MCTLSGLYLSALIPKCIVLLCIWHICEKVAVNQPTCRYNEKVAPRDKNVLSENPREKNVLSETSPNLMTFEPEVISSDNQSENRHFHHFW